MKDTLEFKVEGVNDVMRFLDGIEPKARARIVAPTVRREMRPMVAAMRQKVAVRHGILKRSLGIVQKRFSGGRVVWTRAAPRGGFRYAGSFVVGDQHVEADPRKYAHLVERGTRHSKAQPFARPAFDTHGPRIVRNIGRSLQNQIERMAARDAKRKG